MLYLRTFLYLMICIAVFPQNAKADTIPSIFDNLKRDTLLSLTIETDLKRFVKKKYKEEFQTAWLSYSTVEGDTIRRKVRIRARGNIRKKVCFYPPFKIKFPKKELRSEGLAPKYNDIKVVTGCQNSTLSDQYVLKEYLAYQLYQELSEKSLRTQLAEIQYIDSRKKKKSFKTFAILIEEEDQLAERLGGRVTKPSRISSNHILESVLDEVSLFQYMIGNPDYAIQLRHNIQLIVTPESMKPFPIPYDFDYSGLVNTHYAIPSDRLGIESVTERYFLGRCRSEGTYEAIAEKFIAKKEALLSIAENLPYLENKERKWVLNYLEDFFKILEDPKTFDYLIVKKCLD